MTSTEPFIIHLTVFKSRLGLANIVLPFCSLALQPTAGLLRKVKGVIEERQPVQIQDSSSEQVLRYLVDKNMIGKTTRKRGRYRDYTLETKSDKWVATSRSKSIQEIRVYQPDRWMCQDAVVSTIGVPTPENTEEYLELCYQLKLLTRNKNTITNAGLLIQALRKQSESENPFVLKLERAALFKQVIATDGLMIREIIRQIVKINKEVSRDALAKFFPDIVQRALESAKPVMPPTIYKKGVEFQKLIDPTKFQRGRVSHTANRGPGVTEHRLSPRLEWLVDLGYLSKEGLAKNSFTYKITEHTNRLLENLDAQIGHLKSNWAESVVTKEWNESECWAKDREQLAKVESGQALINAYKLIKRKIGPIPISDVAFLASLLSSAKVTFHESVDSVIEFSRCNEQVALSGGRYKRTPENVFIPDKLLGDAP